MIFFEKNKGSSASAIRIRFSKEALDIIGNHTKIIIDLENLIMTFPDLTMIHDTRKMYKMTKIANQKFTCISAKDNITAEELFGKYVFHGVLDNVAEPTYNLEKI